jgi:citrate synthase
MADKVLATGSGAAVAEKPVEKPKAGLEDIIAATSEICFIDGDEGRLVYRGYDIHDLVKGGATFEEVAHLLWFGKLPNKAELEDTKKQLVRNRRLPKEVIAQLMLLPNSASPMEALRTTVSELALYDIDTHDMSRDANVRKAIRLTAQLATIVAFDERIRSGKDIIQPDPTLGHAANFLYMLTGKVPDDELTRFFDICLILHADHELNASTFACRVTAATLSDIHSAITSGIGTLKGPLHGGANEQVMKMLLEIGDVSRVEGYIQNALKEKKKIMGFGHRVYRTEDPRATHLREMSRKMGERIGNMKWYEMSKRIERIILDEKKLYANVDFYSASTYYAMGIPIDLYTPIFAVSRIAGWTAHVLEQYANNRLIRPMADYIGPKKLDFVPIEKR